MHLVTPFVTIALRKLSTPKGNYVHQASEVVGYLHKANITSLRGNLLDVLEATIRSFTPPLKSINLRTVLV